MIEYSIDAMLERVRRIDMSQRAECLYCGLPFEDGIGFERDHFPVPACAGGEATVWACAKCHDRKDRSSANTLFAWAEDALESDARRVIHSDVEWLFILGRCSLIDVLSMEYVITDIRCFHPRVRVIIAAQIFEQLRGMNRWRRKNCTRRCYA